jgi:hypothetical protein
VTRRFGTVLERSGPHAATQPFEIDLSLKLVDILGTLRTGFQSQIGTRCPLASYPCPRSTRRWPQVRVLHRPSTELGNDRGLQVASRLR